MSTKLRRASKACRRCHERKVRCDVTTVSTPCSNCRFNGIECVALQGRTRGRPRGPNARPKTCPNTRDVRGVSNASRPRYISYPDIRNDMDYLSSSEHSVLNSSGSAPEIDHRIADAASISHTVMVSTPGPPFALLSTNIKPPPPTWTPDDLDYMARKNVFSLPTTKFLSLCVQAYVQWVHFFCPLLDVDEFLDALAQSDASAGRLSLLLLYAVLLTGVAFVDEHHVLEAAYGSCFAARKEFFTRAKLLYSLGYESDRLIQVQSLLLMSYWQEKHDESTNHWYWAEVACAIGRSIGIFQDPQSTEMSEREKRVWKRIGWSCVLRDRLLNLGVRMPAKVKGEEFHLPPLTDADFNIGSPSLHVTAMLPDCKLLQDLALQSRLSRIAAEKGKLCMILGDIFQHLYTETHPRLGSKTQVTLILVPRTSGLDPDYIRSTGNELQKWLRDLDDDLQYNQLQEGIVEAGEQIAFVHLHLLHMLYHCIVCAFYRPQTLTCAPSPVESRNRIAQRMNHATLMITRCFEDLQTQQLLRYLPPGAVTILLTAAINHLVAYKTMEDEEAKKQHLRRFRDCLWYLQPLQRIHVYAKLACLFLTNAARGVGVFTSMKSTTAVDGTAMEMEGEALEPWAVAHTPTLLRRADQSIGDQESTQPAVNEPRAVAVRSEQSRGELEGGLAQMTNNQPVDEFPTVVFPDMDSMSTTSSFMNQAIWEHGWVDQIAETWPGFLAGSDGMTLLSADHQQMAGMDS